MAYLVSKCEQTKDKELTSPSLNQWGMAEETDLVFQDWLMTKDRIRHFDEIVVKIRIEGAPIATAIYGIGVLAFPYAQQVLLTVPLVGWKLSAPSLLFYFGAVYIIAMALMDFLHLKLLGIAVEHARLIEKQEPYKGKLEITTKLTNRPLTALHYGSMFLMYALLAAVGILAGYSLRV